MKRIKIISLTAVIIGLFASISFAQTKQAQTGFNFLSVSSDAKSGAMGDAVNSLTGFSGAMSFNPASMAEMPTFVNASFSMNKYIADINYISASVIISPSSGDYGNIGLSFQSVDYGDVEGTLVDATNPNGYIETGNIKPTAYAIGIGYSKMLNDKFGVGARVKYTSQSLGDSYMMTTEGEFSSKKNKADALAFDFGTVYKTGIKSIAFGMSVTNFSKEIKYEEEKFQLPLLFTIGISANLFDFVNLPVQNQNLMLSVDWTHPRSHPEQIKIGAEYNFMKILSLRGGYVGGNDENAFTYGLGISGFGAEVDYSYTPFDLLGNVQRFTARISL